MPPTTITIDELKTLIKENSISMESPEVKAHIAAQIKEQFDSLTKSDDFQKRFVSPVGDKALDEANRIAAKKFKTLGEFACAVKGYRSFGRFDERLVWINADGRVSQPDAAKTLLEGTDSAGGFLVPPEHLNTLLSRAIEQSIWRPRATVIPMRSDTVTIPTIIDTSHASTIFGGVKMYWTKEAGDKTTNEPAFGEIMLTVHKLAGYTPISNELLMDGGIPLEPLLRRMFGDAVAYFEEDSFINGTGAGQPLGFMNAPCLVTVTRQAAGRVYFDDFVNLFCRMLPEARNEAIWLLNHEAFPELIKLHSYAGARASGANLIWLNPNTNMAVGAPPGTILGRPFFLTEKLSALGTSGDVAFVAPSYYLIGDRQGLTIDVSTHVGFVSDKTYFRVVERIDGQPWLSSAITPRKGTSSTLSPFVVLSTGS
jgi:HK97 family phage major capsid protein